jgi:hypothetical protein
MALGADEMFDTLTFHGGSGLVTVSMSAKVMLSAPFSGGPPGHFFGQADAYIGLEGLDTSGHEIADAADCSPGANSRFCIPFHEGNAVITNSFDTYSITETFSVGDGSVLGLLFTAGAESSGDASASVEDPITVTLPTGVTYTSASGRFLTAAGVPEPAGWACLICGLGLLGAAARGRRTRSLATAP